ncbi:hypothetical protein GXB78_05410 [Pseudomonas moraviensis subsp. stanleyae]|uniref:hypothetical protein n=1 Tax=Pseudomonas moraviensis TaxID=321662 RepID=UPI002E31987F|nr:hypothetical protein [Pseudomonas moraviensis]MED7666646.1 hypothetical protein [Pseudomonas moraviensis subsp. stanleyae]
MVEHLESDIAFDLRKFGFGLGLGCSFFSDLAPVGHGQAKERDAGFAASFGDGDVGNTNLAGQLDHGHLPYFFEQFRNGDALRMRTCSPSLMVSLAIKRTTPTSPHKMPALDGRDWTFVEQNTAGAQVNTSLEKSIVKFWKLFRSMKKEMGC